MFYILFIIIIINHINIIVFGRFPDIRFEKR